LKAGFVQVEILRPNIDYVGGQKKKAVISLQIKEFKQTILTEIRFSPGIKELFGQEIMDVLQNKIGEPLNIVMLNSDLEDLENFLKKKGYFFSRIENKDSETGLLTYSSDLTQATLFFDIDLGKKTFFNSFFFSGNYITREQVFLRESPLKKGDPLTSDKVNAFVESISNTGLFAVVKILPRIVENVYFGENSQLVDLIVEVKERDFRTLEIGPGFRTDLGVRLATKYKFLNIGGMSRRLILSAEMNQRVLEYEALDQSRQGKYPLAFLEFYLDADYQEPFLASSRVAMDLSGSGGRRRYRTFDDNLFITGLTLSESSSWVIGLLRYQYEYDFQYNSTYTKDQGIFQIGSLAPSISFDFRNHKVNPTKGVFFSLIGEFAAPFLGSLDTSENKVEFFSIISRNNFYIPIHQNWVAAMYLTFGYQKNLATTILKDSSGNPIYENGAPKTHGYIPTVKVFRLEGADNVRGWRNSEVNILSDGQDIAEVMVNGMANYLNFKLEMRHYLTDNKVIFPFFDAGNIQANKWGPPQLKAGTGLGFKYLTPMGSLELDFGMKINRNMPHGGKGTFGSINLMIGYF
jgi:outer membrane protein insertion porin family